MKGDVETQVKHINRAQEEMNQLTITLRQVEEYNEQMRDEIAVTRRATYIYNILGNYFQFLQSVTVIYYLNVSAV